MLEKSAPRPSPTTTTHSVPWELPLIQGRKPSSGPTGTSAPRDYLLLQALRDSVQGAEGTFPPRASRPPLRPQTSNHRPRRQGFPGDRAPSDLEPSAPHRFPPLHHCLVLAPKIGLRVPGSLPDLYPLATASIPSFRLLPHCLAQANRVSRTKNSSRPSSRSFTSVSPTAELGTPILTSPILRRSSQLRATVLALGVTQSSAHFPSGSYKN